LLHVAWYRYTVWKHSTWRRLGIHGPTPFPFLGSLKDIGTKVLCYLEYFSTQRNFLNILRPCVDRLPISLMVLEITSTKKGQQKQNSKIWTFLLNIPFQCILFLQKNHLNWLLMHHTYFLLYYSKNWSKRGLNSEFSHIWRAHLTTEILKQDNCQKYNRFNILLYRNTGRIYL
jgi:hypothetical protein